MPSLEDHQSNRFTKLLVMGDSGTGKTGALASLALADYQLRILDFDNGLDVLAREIKKVNPAKLKNVEYVTLRDTKSAGQNGPVIEGIPSAYTSAIKLLDKWTPEKYKLKGTDLGNPRTWGEKAIIVVDTLDFMADMAFLWAEAMNPGVKDRRQLFYTAQNSVADLLSIITSPQFEVNVIVNSHITYVSRPDGTMKGYPASVGKAQAADIPAYFNSVALAETVGTPPKRMIKTASTPLIDLKSPVTFSAPLPIETALADFFKKARE